MIETTHPHFAPITKTRVMGWSARAQDLVSQVKNFSTAIALVDHEEDTGLDVVFAELKLAAEHLEDAEQRLEALISLPKAS